MLKRILIILLVALGVLSFIISWYNEDLAERTEIRATPSKIGTPFKLPLSKDLENPKIVWPALKHATQASNVNIFRVSYRYDAFENPYSVFYICMGCTKTQLYDSFRLSRGHFLTPEETQSGSYYLSTHPSTDPLQVGVLDDIGQNDTYLIYGMAGAFEALPTAGNYTVEAKSPVDADAFFTVFIAELADSGVNVSREDLLSGEIKSEEFFQASESLSLPTLWLATLIVVVLILYHQLYESKRTAVLQLRGLSILSTWFIISGRLIVITMGILLVLGSMTALLIPGATQKLIISIPGQLVLLGIVILLASFITLPFAQFMNIHESLKNRKNTQALVIVNLVMKCSLSIVLVLLTLAGVNQLSALKDVAARIGNWQATSQYGIFYPLEAGDDSDTSSVNERPIYASIVFELYPKLNERGALYIDSSQYASYALETYAESYEKYSIPPPDYLSFVVNPNYLQVYPIQIHQAMRLLSLKMKQTGFCLYQKSI